MYVVYALYSARLDRLYIGQTGDLEKRLEAHRSGRARFTSRVNDWRVIHTEEFKTRAEAMRRERELKTHRGRDWLRQKLGRMR